MKKIVLSLFLGLSSLISSQAQTFVDLNFENAVLTFDSSGFINATNAFPGWTVVSNDYFAEIQYNGNVGQPPGGYIGLQNNTGHTLDGSFSAYLQGGTLGTPWTPILAQTGLIPAGSKSLVFEGAFLITSAVTGAIEINGQPLALQVVGNPQAAVLTYAADVSQYAGQVATLSLCGAGTGVANFYDDIQFSTNPAPEPSTWSILTGGALMIFGCRRLRIFRR